MKAIRLAALSAALLWRAAAAPAQADLPPAALEVLKQYEAEGVEVEKKAADDAQKCREKAVVELKKVQDAFCREAKLDEAILVRDLIRSLKAGNDGGPSPDLPPAAREVFTHFEGELFEIQKKAEESVQKRRDKAAAELKRVQDAFCREAKLDEALAVRDLLRAFKEGATTALPDPGYVNNPAQDIGKVFYYEVVGLLAGQSIYGTDIYTTGSHLGMAAVHCGLLKPGQKGVVKVTILPAQNNYLASTRHGITSYGYGAWGVSFKVERGFGLVGKAPGGPDPEQPK